MDVQTSEHFIDVGGSSVRYEQAGSGPPLLLLHGLVGSSSNWRRNIPAFAQHATVFALDLLNMGGSARVKGLNASLEASADRLAETMDALSLASADIAAHSHGGAIAMMFAARHPSRTRRLILFAPANPFCSLGDRLVGFYTTRVGQWFASTIPRLPLSWKRISLRRMYGDPGRVPVDALRGYTDGLNVPGTIEHVMGIVASWRTDMQSLRRLLTQAITAPTLLIWGDRDRAVGLSSAYDLQQSFPQAELLTLEGVGHMAFEEVPELVNPAVIQWLTSTPAVRSDFRTLQPAL